MRTPKITVLMPVYNAEKFVGEAIESVLNQTFNDFEFLIINDASTDNSGKIIKSYRDPRIRYFKNKKNLGVAKTLNRGLKLAKGEYVARMDADDVALFDKLELQYEALKKEKNLVMVCSHFNYVDVNGKYLSTFKENLLPEEIYYGLQFRNCIAHPTVIFNRIIIFNEFNGYSETYQAEDHELWLRISKKYKIIKLDKALLKVRLSDESKTALFREAIIHSNFTITKNNLETLIGESIDSDVVSALANLNSAFGRPQKIKEALRIIDRLNSSILENRPPFLKKTIIDKCIKRKKSELRFNLFLATLFYSRFESIFRAMFRVYLLAKYRFIRLIG